MNKEVRKNQNDWFNYLSSDEYQPFKNSKTKKELEMNYWEKIKTLDQDTLDYISERITELQVKNFETWENKTEFAKGRDDAFRQCARIFSDIYNHKQIIKKD